MFDFIMVPIKGVLANILMVIFNSWKLWTFYYRNNNFNKNSTISIDFKAG